MVMRAAVCSILVSAVLAGGCAGPTQAAGSGYVAPKLIHEEEPVFPAELKKAGVTGSATVAFTITAAGEVINPYAVQATHPRFAFAAVEAVRLYKFKPATNAGQPVSIGARVSVEFDPHQPTFGDVWRAQQRRPVPVLTEPMPHRVNP
jgi:TonB family protein